MPIEFCRIIVNPVNIIRGLSNGKLLIRAVNSSTTNRPYLSKDNYLCVLSMHVNYHLKYCNIECSPYGYSSIKEQKDIISYTDKYYKALKKCIKQHRSLLKYYKLDYVYIITCSTCNFSFKKSKYIYT